MNKFTVESITTAFTNRVKYNFKNVEEIYNNPYKWPLLDNLRIERCHCIFIDATQAAMTLCNHFLEKSLKQFLIHSDPLGLEYTHGDQVTEHYRKMNQLYSGLDLSEAINKCKSKGLILKEEAKVLWGYRDSFRNGFSHADPEKTFGDRTQAVMMLFPTIVNDSPVYEAKVSELPQLQADAQKRIADQEATEYFKYIDNLIRKVMPKIMTNLRYHL